MTPTEVIQRFQIVAAEHPDVADAFLEARQVWHDAVAHRSRNLAEAAGMAFGRLCELVDAAADRPLDAHDRDVLREMLASPMTPGEAGGARSTTWD